MRWVEKFARRTWWTRGTFRETRHIDSMPRTLAVLFVVLIATGCQKAEDVYLLETGWEMKIGAHPGDASSSTWEAAQVPGNYHRLDKLANYSGWITLRVRVPAEAIKLHEDGVPVAFYSGFAGGPRRFFVDGVQFYALDDPDHPQSLHRHSLVVIPRRVLQPRSQYLEVSIYGAPARPFLNWAESRVPVQIGGAESVVRNFYTAQAAEIGIIVAYFVVGFMHLFFFSQRPRDSHNVLFGFFACFSGIFWFTMIPPEFVPVSYDFVRHQVKLAALFAVGPFFLTFLDKLIRGRVTRITKAFSIVSGVLILAVFLVHDWLLQARILQFWENIGLGMGAYAAVNTLAFAWRGNADAQRMVPGVILLVIIAFHDMLKAHGIVNTPVLGRYSLLIVILGSTTILAGRFLRLHLQVQDLNQELIRMNHDLIEADLAREKARWDQERLRADLHDALGAKLLDLKHIARAAMGKLGKDGIGEDLMSAADAAGRILREELVHQEDVRLMREDFVKGVRLILLRRYARVERPFLFEADDGFSDGFESGLTGWTDVLYPVLQELASNDLKYGIGPAHWRLHREDGRFVVELVTTSTYSEAREEHGFGTSIMQARLARAGGSLLIRPGNPDFRVRVELPVLAT